MIRGARTTVTTPDTGALKGRLQPLESMLNSLDGFSAAATQLIDAEKSGKPLSAKTLDD